jgi:hypothetical protein
MSPYADPSAGSRSCAQGSQRAADTHRELHDPLVVGETLSVSYVGRYWLRWIIPRGKGRRRGNIYYTVVQ